jgi:hypothetical protein
MMGKTQALKGVTYGHSASGKLKTITFDVRLYKEKLEDFLEYLEAEEAAEAAKGQPVYPAKEVFERIYKERGLKEDE